MPQEIRQATEKGFAKRCRSIISVYLAASANGGIDLAAEWAGFRTVGFVERDRYCQRVLRKHWPDVPILDDIRDFHGEPGQAFIVSGGFPCQDISSAGRKVGLGGEKSGLWREYARVIGEIRPRYVVVENVSALLARGLGDVLGDLAALGYDAEWHCIPAAAVGAPHRRDRVFVVAYADADREPVMPVDDEASWMRADGEWNAWDDEDRPGTVGVDDGLSSRMDRLRALGNAVVPQQIYPIFKAIADYERLAA